MGKDLGFRISDSFLPGSNSQLDVGRKCGDNCSMEIPGHVQNGVLVLDGGATLAEGTRVVVSQVSRVGQGSPAEKKRIELPLVSSGEPGSVHLTNERIGEIFDEEHFEAMKRTWNVPS
jgi:hypothetical protein